MYRQIFLSIYFPQLLYVSINFNHLYFYRLKILLFQMINLFLFINVFIFVHRFLFFTFHFKEQTLPVAPTESSCPTPILKLQAPRKTINTKYISSLNSEFFFFALLCLFLFRFYNLKYVNFSI